jgi:hypothetical protein
MADMNKQLDWVLRVAVCGEFLGHGMLAIAGKAQWVKWIQEIIAVDASTATTLLLGIGLLDVVLAVLVLLWPNMPRALLLWMAIWGFWTAILRPIVGESVWDFVERSANWGAPLALLILRGWPKKAIAWLK